MAKPTEGQGAAEAEASEPVAEDAVVFGSVRAALSDTSIVEALDIMELAKRSGIVTTIDGQKTVIEASDLIPLARQARMRGRNIGDVIPARPTGELPGDPIANYLATETALDDQHAYFGVLESLGEHVVVVTRHEGIAVELGRPSGYYACKGPQRHQFGWANLPTSMICDRGDNEPIEWVDP